MLKRIRIHLINRKLKRISEYVTSLQLRNKRHVIRLDYILALSNIGVEHVTNKHAREATMISRDIDKMKAMLLALQMKAQMLIAKKHELEKKVS